MMFTAYPYWQKLLLTFGIVLMSITTFSQTKEKTITLNFKEEPLSQVIKFIEQQTNYRIIYNVNKIDINQKVTVSVKNSTLENALTKLLKDRKISFFIQKEQILLLEISDKAASQEKERFIKGIVLDSKDKLPVPGATILIKGTSTGAISDSKGKFVYLLRGDAIPNTVLEVSYLGMKTQSVRVGNAFDFVFNMEQATDELDQVVITSSYGTKKLKEEIVGSISTLNAKDIAVEQASESIDKMVVGQIAGVLIENTSGIGGPVKINIRGQGSLSSLTNSNLGTSTQPLIIVDGVIMSEEVGIDSQFFDANGTFSENLSNPLAQISPENIESFTVLKDAAAVSIYGADGANGVILITTKKGKKGKAKFGFSNQLGVSSAINPIKYLSGFQYNDLRNEYLKNSQTNYVPVPYNGINTDWFDLLNVAGIYNKYNFNVSGANSKLSYRSSLSYLTIDEPQKGNKTKQFNAGINLGYRLDKFDFSLSMNPSYIQKDAPNIYYSYAFVPTISPYNADGTYATVGVLGLGNPLAAIEQNKNITDSYGILASLNASYEFNKFLSFSTLFGIDYKDKTQDRYFSGANESGQYNGSFTLEGLQYPNWGRRLLNERNSTKWNWQGQALFNKTVNIDHNIDGIFGFELSSDKANFNYSSGRGFVNPNGLNNVQDAIRDDDPLTTVDESLLNQTYGDDISYSSRVSFFSQFNYNYKKRYYFLGNFRRDESSVFGDDTNVALNGGAGLSWIVSNEDFLKSNSGIDLLKFKISYGTTGNSRIGSYRSKGLYILNQNGYNGAEGSSPSEAPNGQLSWEKNTKFNAGIDFNFLGRVELSLEYFYDDLKDLITSRDIPTETGYNSIQLNAASMYNKGLEFSTRIKWLQSDQFKWTTSFNISTVENKVTQLVGLGSEFSTSEVALAQKVGYSTSTIWGVKWAGVDPATGRDLVEKDGQIYDAATYTNLFTAADWVPIGDNQPKAYGGFNNNFTINNAIVLSIRGAFQLGGDYLVDNSLISKYNITSNRNLSVNAYDYWRNQGDVVSQPLVISNTTLIPNLSKFLYDATYLKISNINLSYNVPFKKTFLDALSVFVDVSNVVYWYKDKSPSGRNGIREFNFTYPQARTISLGFNTKF
ncbi:TonB-linked SusC/RagA family outer membrane protein [Flavobacterium sp. CG_9.1]|uniref:SusC/RagA family TonB-linked outer membrane protein n=1 Tax=Flavobacterium sp. CG_9.1 TaxID=2787728 RepID=UPI0018CA84FD|nr:SusC/RagA family TonB-linked outer membrane protein [Flavobacterium sp. CG_9.1]MBG6060533.1 TonB-linked SusC/RagA family outer membrane protein [Flavobacterium sp. CG_9.1]